MIVGIETPITARFDLFGKIFPRDPTDPEDLCVAAVCSAGRTV
jgi:hypothetical protein